MSYSARNDKANTLASKWQRRLSVVSLPMAAIALTLSYPQIAMALGVGAVMKANVHLAQSNTVDAKADHEALRERLSHSRENDGNYEALRERLRRRTRTVSCEPCNLPDYPEEALESGVEGAPVVTIFYDENGGVVDAVLERSSGNAALDRAALEAVRQYELNTNENGGTVSVEIDFTIEGRSRPIPLEPSE